MSKELRKDTLKEWPCESCDFCGERNVIGFSVVDLIWMKVIGDEYKISCPACFDRKAQEKKIKYKFDKLFPITWGDNE